MAKPLQPHASFCTCAECTHAALHPSPPQTPPEPDNDGLEIIVADVDCRVCGGKGEVVHAEGDAMDIIACPRCSMVSGAV